MCDSESALDSKHARRVRYKLRHTETFLAASVKSVDDQFDIWRSHAANIDARKKKSHFATRYQ